MHLRNSWKVLILMTLVAVTACAGQQETSSNKKIADRAVLHDQFEAIATFGKKDVEAFREVIALHINAIHRNDAEAAYKLATPKIQSLFPTPQAFMRTVRKLYQPIYQAEQYSFEKAIVLEREIVQPVRIAISPDLPLLALFVLEQQSDGAWRIGGCILLRDNGQNV